jgi:hypothetical protein
MNVNQDEVKIKKKIKVYIKLNEYKNPKSQMISGHLRVYVFELCWETGSCQFNHIQPVNKAVVIVQYFPTTQANQQAKPSPLSILRDTTFPIQEMPPPSPKLLCCIFNRNMYIKITRIKIKGIRH